MCKKIFLVQDVKYGNIGSGSVLKPTYTWVQCATELRDVGCGSLQDPYVC